MAFGKSHEIHERRLGRNLGVAGVLLGFIAIVFGLTVAKVSAIGPIQGYDHTPRPELVVPSNGTGG